MYPAAAIMRRCVSSASHRPTERSFTQWNEHKKQRSVFLRRIGYREGEGVNGVNVGNGKYTVLVVHLENRSGKVSAPKSACMLWNLPSLRSKPAPRLPTVLTTPRPKRAVHRQVTLLLR